MMIAARSSWDGPTKIGVAYAPASIAVTGHNTYRPALLATATVAEERAAMLSMHRDHVNNNRWAGIGYHFVIFQSGRIYEARGWGRVGAHASTAAGNRTIGVAFAIDGETTAPSAKALAAFWWLGDEGVRLDHLTTGHTIKVHSDWKATICPGRKVVEALRRSASVSIVLRRGDRSEYVGELQDLLVLLRYMTAEQRDTGRNTFGPRTDEALRAFVMAHD